MSGIVWKDHSGLKIWMFFASPPCLYRPCLHSWFFFKLLIHINFLLLNARSRFTIEVVNQWLRMGINNPELEIWKPDQIKAQFVQWRKKRFWLAMISWLGLPRRSSPLTWPGKSWRMLTYALLASGPSLSVSLLLPAHKYLVSLSALLWVWGYTPFRVNICTRPPES